MTADHRLQTANFLPAAAVPSSSTTQSVVPSSVVSSLACERKHDPYATPAHKSVNAFLVVLTALLIFIVFRTSPLAHRGSRTPGNDRADQSRQQFSK